MRAAIALGALLACRPDVLALDPSLDISQYAHSSWKIREGFFRGTIESIAQTPDGYLWLGTEFGLLRFNGVQMAPWRPPTNQRLPNSHILKLLTGGDGRLWIGVHGGLASWKDGKLTQYPELSGQIVRTLLEDHAGTVWAGGWTSRTGRLCAIQGASVQCYGQDGKLGLGILSLYEDKHRSLWAGAQDGVWQWIPGPPRFYPMPEPVHALAEGDDGALLIFMSRGTKQLVRGKVEVSSLPGGAPPYLPLRDRDRGLWAVAQQGLLRVHERRTDVFTQADGLSGDNISALFEDREGNIWVATNNGLDRFRDLSVVTISAKQGLCDANHVSSVLAVRDGSVWIRYLDCLNRWKDGQITIYRRKGPSDNRVVNGRLVREIADSGFPDGIEGSLMQDRRGRIWISSSRGVGYFEKGRFVPVSGVSGTVVHSMAEDSAGDIWIPDEQGLSCLRDARVVEQFPWDRLGKKDFAATLVSDPGRGGIWLGFFKGGVSYFKSGQVRASYVGSDGLGDGRVNSLRLDGDGTLWAATLSGLNRIKDGRITTLNSRNGLPCDAVDWVMEDDAHVFWLNMACGLVQIARRELDSWVADSKRTVQATVFDSSDGVESHADYGLDSPRVTKSLDGKLWFSARNGVSVIDPRHLAFNKLPPPVHIEQIFANGKRYDIARGLRLPPRVRNLAIDFVALSLVAPEQNRYRFKLEGWDSEWIDAVNELRVEYTNLPPRDYRFRVMACNNSGVWNETGDTLEFSIAPAWNQTTGFYAACVAAFLAAIWGLYRLRLYQIAREFNAQLDGRVEERLRVARDLHDTMLQTFQAAVVQMQAGYNLLSRRPEKAAEAIQTAITTSVGAIAEGREAIQNMRSSTVEVNDLARCLRITADQMAAEGSATFDIRVQGGSRDLHPILRDDIYRIALEALRNAFKHAEAKAIEAEIVYGDSLKVRIRDDGKGIDPAILKEGRRSGHYGLRGMRERAERIGGKLDVWSGAGAGTEIQLSIPGNIAFGRPSGDSLLGRFRRKPKGQAAAQS